MKKTDKEIDKETPVEISAAVSKMMEELPNTLVGYKLIAKSLKSYYDSLVEEGFTKQEALQIILHRGLNP